MFFKPISFCQGKNSQQHTIQKVHVNKGNLGFCTFFFGHVIRVTENCLRFFILSLEHHWQKTPKHSRSHLNEPKFDWSWKCAFFVVEIDRPHEHCASKCSVDFFLLNKQTVIYALDRFTVEWPIFFVRFDVFAGMEKNFQGDDKFMIWICAIGNGQAFFSLSVAALVKRHMTFTKFKKWTSARWPVESTIFAFTNLFHFFSRPGFFYMSCAKRQPKKDNFDIRILLIHHEN